MKVNDYVKTKDGLIHKITDIFNTTKQVATDKGKYVYEYNEIVKSSPNIIDLIEVGDYVNGYIVNEITDIDTGLPVLCNFDLNTMRWTPLEEIDIWYSILTKEQFERCEYKI